MHTPNRSKPSMRCRFWLPNRPQKMRRLSIRALQEPSHSHHLPTQTQTHNRQSSQCSNLFSRCKAWGATVFRNSSWRLAQPRKMFRKSARLWHRLCGHWRQGSRILNLAPRRTPSRAKWWARTKSYPMEYASQENLDNEWWRGSMECYCYLRNKQDLFLSDEKTPCESRLGELCRG